MEYEQAKGKNGSLCCCDDGCCKGEGCSVKVAFWIALCVGIIAFISGAVLVPIGLDHQEQADALDPQAEFTALDSPCTITSVEYVSAQQERCSKSSGKSSTSYDCGCRDTFFYRFDASELANVEGFVDTGDNYVFSSTTFELKRPNVNSCDDGSAPAVPSQVTGDTMTCWRPTDPNKALPWQYKCGTETCIKVFDPQDDVNAALTNSTAMWAGGTFLLCLFAFMFCCMIPCYLRIKKTMSSSNNGSGDELPMTTHQAPENDYTAGNTNYNNNNAYNASNGPVTYYK